MYLLPLKLPLFTHLSEEELVQIDANRHEVSFNAGEIILKQGAPLTHIVCLTKGMATSISRAFIKET